MFKLLPHCGILTQFLIKVGLHEDFLVDGTFRNKFKICLWKCEVRWLGQFEHENNKHLCLSSIRVKFRKLVSFS